MNRRHVLAVAVSSAALIGGCASAPPPAPVVAPPAAAAPPPPAAPAGPHFARGDGHLVLVPIEGSQSVAVRLLFYTGSIDDPADKAGLTALTAQLMAEGGTATKAYPKLLEALYPLAANISVQVDKEQTVFFGEVHVDRVQDFLPLISEVVTAPAFDAAAFERIRRDMIDDIEKRLRATDDENLGKELLNLMLYPGDHPYGHFVGGSVQGLMRATLDDVKAHAASVFGRRRLVIGLAGAVDSKLGAALQAALKTLPPGLDRVESVRAAPIPTENEVVIAEKPSARAVAISVGYPHFARRGHPDWPALALLQSFFGEHRQFHGVLMDELREKRGLNYGDYAYVEAFHQEGWGRLPLTNVARRRQHFEMWIRPVAPQDAVFSLKLALLYLDRLVRGGLNDQDVAGIRSFLNGYTNLFAMTPMRRLGYALDDHFYGTDSYLADLRAKLAGLDAGQVNEALRRHLVPQPVRIAVVAPRAVDIVDGLTSGMKLKHTYSSRPTARVLEDDDKADALALPLSETSIRVIPVDALFAK